MNPSAIYSKSGKGVQEASGKTSQLARAERAILSAFDGRLTVTDVAQRVGKPYDAKFEQTIVQLEKDGYIREVSSGTPSVQGKPPAAKPAAAAPAKPAASGGATPGPDLDFTIAIPAAPTPKAPAKAATMAPAAAARAETEKKAQEDNMTRARREAEERQHKERDRIKAEAEAKLRVETEAKMRSEAAQKAKADAEKAKADAEAKIRAEAEAKIKAARDAAVRAAAEAERKAKEEADRIRREAEEKARKEAAELQRKLDEERRAREEAERARLEAERKAKEEAERVRREAEEKARREAAELQRKLDEERRAREEAERARQEAERKAREEAERARKEAERAREEADRRARAEADKQAREEADKQAREEADRSVREAAEQQDAEARAAAELERAAAEMLQAQQAQQQAKAMDSDAAKSKGAASGSFDSLLADLDSFSDREDQDKKAKEEAEKKSKEEKARRQREEAEAKAREEAERKSREADERKRREQEERAREEEKRKAREEEEARQAREEEERKAEERKRKRREEALAKEGGAAKSDDIGVSDDDLGMDDIKADQEAVSKESRKAQRQREREAKERESEARERAREREREAKRAASGPAVAPAGGYKPFRRKRSWGKPIALTLLVLLVAGVGALHVMPINTQDYEKAASEALGRPVRIGVAHLSLYKGVVLSMENISIGDAKISAGRAYPEIGSLFDEKKTFSRIELDGATLPQDTIGEFLNAKLRNDKFYVARLVVNKVKLTGPLPMPQLDAEVAVGPQGSIGTINVRGPDNLAAKLTPVGSDVDFEATASGFTVPFLPDVTLSTFAMKGRATRQSARIESWGGAIVGGAVNGNANVRWGGNWTLDGTMTLRGINAAVFAPALLSEGNAEGTARFSMSDADPSKFKDRGRVEGTFSLNKGVLGSFDLSRAILTGGRQASGRTPFTEMTGQGVFDRGAVTLRNVTFGAGAMNATANADITPEGALSGRIVADIRTAAQNLRATVNVGGTVGEPQVK